MEINPFLRENLIISSDDFGISAKANQNILELAESGRLDRVAVLINRHYSTNEISRLSASGIKIDLHLDMQESSPREGLFGRTLAFVLHYLLGGISTVRVGKKWDNQLAKFQAVFKKNPDGINSHLHIHFFPPYFKIALKLAEKNKIAYVRLSRFGLICPGRYVYFILRFFWKINIGLFKKSSLDSSDYFVSFDWIRDFPKFLEKLPPGKTELIFHPEREDEFEAIKR